MTRMLWQLREADRTLSCVVEDLEESAADAAGLTEVRLEEGGALLVREVYAERQDALIRSVIWRAELQRGDSRMMADSSHQAHRPGEARLWR